MTAVNIYDIQSFTYSETENSERQCQGVIQVNADHPVFDGHFPGNPVVPGVYQVQMVKDLVEKALNHPVKLFESDNIKFLSMINPQETTLLEFNIHIKPITASQFTANANIGSGSKIFLKFKGKFKLEAGCKKR